MICLYTLIFSDLRCIRGVDVRVFHLPALLKCPPRGNFLCGKGWGARGQVATLCEYRRGSGGVPHKTEPYEGEDVHVYRM